MRVSMTSILRPISAGGKGRVSDYERAKAFDREALAPLGITERPCQALPREPIQGP
jgi:hypothetical protein